MSDKLHDKSTTSKITHLGKYIISTIYAETCKYKTGITTNSFYKGCCKRFSISLFSAFCQTLLNAKCQSIGLLVGGSFCQ